MAIQENEEQWCEVGRGGDLSTQCGIVQVGIKGVSTLPHKERSQSDFLFLPVILSLVFLFYLFLLLSRLCLELNHL